MIRIEYESGRRARLLFGTDKVAKSSKQRTVPWMLVCNELVTVQERGAKGFSKMLVCEDDARVSGEGVGAQRRGRKIGRRRCWQRVRKNVRFKSVGLQRALSLFSPLPLRRAA